MPACGPQAQNSWCWTHWDPDSGCFFTSLEAKLKRNWERPPHSMSQEPQLPQKWIVTGLRPHLSQPTLSGATDPKEHVDMCRVSVFLLK